MTDTPITDIFHDTCDRHPQTIMRALVATTADGPVVEDVWCPTCRGLWMDCPDCDHGTVRLVVMRTDPALAERLRDAQDPNNSPPYIGYSLARDIRRAADLIGGADATARCGQ
jgi:hypothetical protein